MEDYGYCLSGNIISSIMINAIIRRYLDVIVVILKDSYTTGKWGNKLTGACRSNRESKIKEMY
jgi:hypothetical protein